MDIDPGLAVTAAGAAVVGVDAALSSLVDVLAGGDLDRLDVSGLVGLMRAFERVRNRMSLADHRLVSECERREVADLLNLRNTKTLLVDRLHISDVEARRRVSAAAVLGQRRSLSGDVREPECAVMAAAQQAGEVSPEQVAIIGEAFEAIGRVESDPVVLGVVEADLTRSAVEFGPRDLRKAAASMVYAYDQDGKAPDDDRLTGQRRFRLGTARDGSVRGSFVLTPEVGAMVVAVLSALSKPRPDPPSADGAHVADAHRDSRSLEQRQHDALGDVFARVLRPTGSSGSGGVGSGGVSACVVVTISADDLMGRSGAGETSFGHPVSVEQVLRLAGEADIYPVVLTASGEPLSLGRSRRIASRGQSMALVARDGGCSFPGCDQPPEWCDRHHVRGWVEGGLTDLNNLTLLCRYHHTRFLGKGWTCRINAEGIPEWVPPRWQDPSQTPMVHHRILRLQLQKRIRARGRPAGSAWAVIPTPEPDRDPADSDQTDSDQTDSDQTDSDQTDSDPPVADSLTMSGQRSVAAVRAWEDEVEPDWAGDRSQRRSPVRHRRAVG